MVVFLILLILLIIQRGSLFIFLILSTNTFEYSIYIIVQNNVSYAKDYINY